MILMLYNLFLPLVLLLASPVLGVWLATSPKARSGFRQKLGHYPVEFLDCLNDQRASGKKRVWIHAVSVGEFNAIRPVIEALQNHVSWVITTTTRTGQGLARKTYPHLPVTYFPYDLSYSVDRALETLAPDLIVIAETELWPNMIGRAAQKYGKPVILINGRLSPRSFKGYQRIGFLIGPVLRHLTHLFVQSPADGDRFYQLGAPKERITVAGNLKFDLDPHIDGVQRDILSRLLNVTPKDSLITMASTHHGEDLPLLETYLTMKKDFPELKLVIAPRHPERVPEIRNLLTAKGVPHSLRSQLSDEAPSAHDVAILDTIGELLTVLSLSRLAVMGGSFVEHGGQNPLEPISQRVPVIFGPHMFNFADISQQILESRAGFQVQSPTHLVDVITELLTQPEVAANVVENGQLLLSQNRGAKQALSQGICKQLGIHATAATASAHLLANT